MALTNLLPHPSESPAATRIRAVHLARLRRLAGPLLIVLAAAIAAAPVALHRPLCADDLQFHLVSWIDVQHNWQAGWLYPHWAPSANFGAGEPRFIFYPPLTWILGGALGLILPWTLVPGALTFLLLAACGLATRALARQALPDRSATLAGCAAVFSGYALFCAYERAAFGEMCSAVWIPLLLLFALRESSPSGAVRLRVLDRSVAPLAVALACAWLSDAPGGVMASYLLAAVAVAAAVLRRSWYPVVRATIAFLLGLGLCAFYVLPAAWEQRWVDIQQGIGVNGDPGMRIENNWLFPRHADPLLNLHDQELRFVSWVAVFMIAVAVACAGVLWLRGKAPNVRHPSPRQFDRAWWIPLALIPAAALFLMLPISLPVWNLLPKLRYLQFPWRWLMVTEAPIAVLFAAALRPAAKTERWQRRVVAAACGLFFLGSALFAAQNFFRADRPEDRLPNIVAAASSRAGVVGADEYAPLGADNSIVATGLPDACLVADFDRELGIADDADANPVWRADQPGCIATATATLRQPQHLHVSLAPAAASFAILRLRGYPAWRITVDGRLISGLPARADGLIAVPVPAVSAGQRGIEVDADWVTTEDVVLSRWLSSLAFLLLFVLGFHERRHRD